jgi:C-terminal processing protease CtpA/Prc
MAADLPRGARNSEPSLPAGTDLFYFQRKNRPKILLRTLPSRIHYTGDLAILVDKGSGSASELFAGTLQKRGRAFLVEQRIPRAKRS